MVLLISIHWFFKEFHEYLVLSEEKSSDSGRKIFEKRCGNMKLATRQYARKQTKWILNRFLKKPDRQLPPVYGLQATNLDLWKENVLLPAVDIIESIIQGKKPAQNPLPVEEGINEVKELYYCDVCEKVILGQKIWEKHLKSKKHYKIKRSKMKQSSQEVAVEKYSRYVFLSEFSASHFRSPFGGSTSRISLGDILIDFSWRVVSSGWFQYFIIGKHSDLIISSKISQILYVQFSKVYNNPAQQVSQSLALNLMLYPIHKFRKHQIALCYHPALRLIHNLQRQNVQEISFAPPSSSFGVIIFSTVMDEVASMS
ncbi:tRNA dimethylallyltransferase, partial [Caerostris extrusa]